MYSDGWENLHRICVQRCRVKCVNFTRCSKVTVLKLDSVYVENEALDLSPLKMLKSLEIIYGGQWCDSDEEIGESEWSNTGVLKVSGIGQLASLTVLIWLNIGDESLSAVGEIFFLRNLRILQLKSEISIIMKTSTVQKVRVQFQGMVTISASAQK